MTIKKKAKTTMKKIDNKNSIQIEFFYRLKHHITKCFLKKDCGCSLPGALVGVVALRKQAGVLVFSNQRVNDLLFTPPERANLFESPL